MFKRQDLVACVGVIGIALGAAAGGSQYGCAALSNTCSAALPHITAASALLADAQEALRSAEAVISTMPPSVRTAAHDALVAARAGLRAAADSVYAASTACTTPDIPKIFAAFVHAWQSIRNFIEAFSGVDVATAGDPLVYSLAKGQRR